MFISKATLLAFSLPTMDTRTILPIHMVSAALIAWATRQSEVVVCVLSSQAERHQVLKRQLIFREGSLTPMAIWSISIQRRSFRFLFCFGGIVMFLSISFHGLCLFGASFIWCRSSRHLFGVRSIDTFYPIDIHGDTSIAGRAHLSRHWLM